MWLTVWHAFRQWLCCVPCSKNYHCFTNALHRTEAHFLYCCFFKHFLFTIFLRSFEFLVLLVVCQCLTSILLFLFLLICVHVRAFVLFNSLFLESCGAHAIQMRLLCTIVQTQEVTGSTYQTAHRRSSLSLSTLWICIFTKVIFLFKFLWNWNIFFVKPEKTKCRVNSFVVDE